MGNKEAKEETVAASSSSSSRSEGKLEAVFNQLVVDNSKGILTEEKLKTVFGDSLGQLTYNYLSNNGRDVIDKERFVSRAAPFFGTSSDAYYKFILGNKDHVNAETFSKAIELCSRTSGATLVNSDKDRAFLQLLANNLFSTSIGDHQCSIEEFKSWINNVCPRLLDNVQKTISYGLKHGKIRDAEKPIVVSEILSPFQVWFLQSCIPQAYLSSAGSSQSLSSLDSSATKTPFNWTLLYSSREHGLSHNRFETKVFNYRSPTVVILCLQSNEVYAVGVDCEWRQSAQPFGGVYCFAYQLFPKFEIFDQNSSIIYYNTKLRAVPTGFMVYHNQQAPFVKVDSDFTNLADMEVWGCGAPDASSAQLEQQKWEKRQAEKHAKVPLPGKWDENPDKAILEIAGIKVNHAEQ